MLMSRNVVVVVLIAVLALLSGKAVALQVENFDSLSGMIGDMLITHDWENDASLTSDKVEGSSAVQLSTLGQGVNGYGIVTLEVWQGGGSQDWSAYDTAYFWAKYSGQGSGNKGLNFQLYTDPYGLIASQEYFITDTWTRYELDIAGKTGIDEVGHVRFLSYDGNLGGTEVYLDDMGVIPEPATLILLGIGGLFVRRRRTA